MLATEPISAGPGLVGGVLDGYLRNSTLDQVNNLRADHQRRALPELAAAAGFGCRLWEEQGVSGESLDNRPMLREILQRIRNKVSRGIAAVAFDRLSRDEDILDGLYIWQVCARAGAVLVTPEQVWHPGRDHADLLVAFVKFWQAAAYKKDTLKNMAEGLVERARLAPVFRGTPPGGYARVPGAWVTEAGKRVKGTTLALDEPSRPALVRVFREWPLRSDHAIARGLNRDGIPYRYWDGRAGDAGAMVEVPWTESHVRRVVKRPVYSGLWEWGAGAGERYGRLLGTELPRFEVPHLAFVDYPAWQACQLDKPGRPVKKGQPRRAENRGLSGGIFRGLLFCPECDAPLYLGSRTVGAARLLGHSGARRLVPTYRCARYHRHGTQADIGCANNAHVTEESLCESVAPVVANVLRQLDRKAVFRRAAEERAGLDAKRAELEERVRVARGAKSKLLDDALLRTAYSEAELVAKARDYGVRIADLERQLVALGERPAGVSGPLALVEQLTTGGELPAVLAGLTRDEWRVVVRALFERVYIRWEKPGRGRGRQIRPEIEACDYVEAVAEALVSKQGLPPW